jgi:hypothetical protein
MVFPVSEGRFSITKLGMIDTISPFIETQKSVFVLMVSIMKPGFQKHNIQSASPAFYDYEKTTIIKRCCSLFWARDIMAPDNDAWMQFWWMLFMPLFFA